MTFGNKKSGLFFGIAILFAFVLASGLIIPSAVYATSGDEWGDTTWGGDSWGDTTYSDGWGDTTYNDGWGDTTYNDGWGDTTYNDGWGDTTYNDGWGDTTYNDGWGGTTYGSDEWGGTTLGSDEWGGTTLGTDSWGGTTLGGYDSYCDCDYVYEDGVAYSERFYDSYGNVTRPMQTASASMPSFSMPSFGRAPSTSYSPSYPQPRPQPYPVYQQPRQQQQQQQQQQQGGGQPINIVNTNNNNNVNNNVNTAQVTPVYQAPVTYPVQYVYPQQPVYPTYPTYPTQNTYCVITASPSSITNGQAAYLSWSSTGASSAWLSDGIGQVAINGSLAVRPNNSTMYTLTVSGYGGTRTCTAYVTVQGSYISLSQIPYTGFDAGLLGNALYWLSLISFAAAGAYLTVYYLPRNVFGGAGTASTLAFAGSSLRARKQNAVAHETVQIPEESKVEVVETPVETMTPSPIDVMEFLPVASVAHSTKDAMQVLPSKEGGAPRIVITRS